MQGAGLPHAAAATVAARGRKPAVPTVTRFSQLPLPAALVAALDAHGVTEPFPIQAATLPDSLAGRDVLGRGRTGSGKTLAFGLPLLARTAAAVAETGHRAEAKRPLALVLVPTRELAGQVSEALEPYAKAMRLRITSVVGGASITRQSAALRTGAEVLVATPGRLADLIDRQACALDRVAVTVLDEADQMADMGFLPQVTRLLEQVRPGGQRMLFSATLDRNVDRLVKRFLSNPVSHSVDPSSATVTTMEHHVLHVDEGTKRAVTAEIAARQGGVIMFVGTKRGADRLTKHLLGQGVRAVALHGGKSQPQRNRALDQFRAGTADALVATNVAARGIHIEGLDLVVNVDPPTEAKDYLHRGGRTARAGESGTVVTLVLPEQRRENARLMAAAGIRPQTARVRPGDPDLIRITGARRPTGTPVALPVPEQPAPAAQAAAKTGGGRSRRRRGSGSGTPAANATGASAARRTGAGAGTGAAAGGRRTGAGTSTGRGGAAGRRARGEGGRPRRAA
ncbi:DEAD/DEAH box helicase [Streptomyces sp. V4-01]|uniref:DEAD/DEAH box helicase n=1 Tax=Actinacidiphila polyblastidii TaxID=3110430 RepID=A0ABU7P4L2_9ACTN|nr:DEAD/DEAH box helicase [Streptomyces sp. V4-01]